MKSAIKIRNLTKIFNKKVRAVDNISFDVLEGEIFGLLGSNGSGKSTTLRMLATVLEPTSGRIDFQNADHNRNKIRNIIGYIPQQDLLYEDLSVTDNLKLFSRSYNLSDKQRMQKIEDLLDKLELVKYRRYFAGDLSGGYKKRLSIAIALLHDPKIIIADEITIGLDPDLRGKIWDLLFELKKESSIIFTTHYLEEAEKLCDHIALMDLGKILVRGKPREIIKANECENLECVFRKLVVNKKKR
jgi:ABC-2 type transport system ATP-binding protein